MKRIIIAILLILIFTMPVMAAGTAKQVDFLLAGVTDSSGNPLSGGKVYTYIAGGSTATFLYTNKEKTTLAANPVILDAYGRAQIYGDGIYKLVLKTSADVTVATLDNLIYIVSDYYSPGVYNVLDYGTAYTDVTVNAALTALGTTEGTLLFPSGAWTLDANVTIPKNLSLEVTRGTVITVTSGHTFAINGPINVGRYQFIDSSASPTITIGFQDPVFPEWFGAKADGSTNDRDAIDTAIDATGYSVLFDQNRTYKISSGSITMKDNLKLYGKATLEFANTVAYLFSSAASGGDTVEISDLKFKMTTKSGTPDVIQFAGHDNIYIHGCEFDFVTANLNTCGRVNVDKCYFHDQWYDHNYDASNFGGANGFWCVLDINANNTNGSFFKVTNCKFENVWTAVQVDNANDVTITGNDIYLTADTAIFDRCTQGPTYRKNISYNKIKDCGKSAIKTLDTNNLTGKGHDSKVIGNTIENWGMKLASAAILSANYFDYGVTNVYMLAPSTQKAHNLTISNNTITETSALSCSSVFQVYNIKNLNVTNNIIELYDATDYTVRNMFSWCISTNFNGNNLNNVTPDFYNNFYTNIQSNVFLNTNGLQMQYEDHNMIISGNIIENTGSVAIGNGISWVGDGTFSAKAAITNNYFRFENATSDDDNQVTSKNPISFGNTIALKKMIDGNTFQYADKTKLQKMITGDFAYPVYYQNAPFNAYESDSTAVYLFDTLTRGVGPRYINTTP